MVDVRALGLVAAVEVTAGVADRVQRALLADGILIRPLGDVVYLMPPLVIADSELDALSASFCKAIRDA